MNCRRACPIIASIKAEFLSRPSPTYSSRWSTCGEPTAPEASPRWIVLGVSPRFLGEIPPQRAFVDALTKYSGKLRVVRPEHGPPRLEQKTLFQGLVGRVRFVLGKQKERYQAALYRVGGSLLGDRPRSSVPERPLARGLAAKVLSRLGVPGALIEMGPHAYLLWHSSPYKYRGEVLPAAELTELLDSPRSFWAPTYAWEPAEHLPAVRRRVDRLRRLAATDGARIAVVGLPERRLSRQRYRPGHEDSYAELLETAFDGLPFLDLRCLLDDSGVQGCRASSARRRGEGHETRCALHTRSGAW